jgi:Fe2+ transport system protein B
MVSIAAIMAADHYRGSGHRIVVTVVAELLMSLTQRLVILAGLVGLMFYTASLEQLWAVMVDYQLSWYSLGVPLAWGLYLFGYSYARFSAARRRDGD